MVDASNSSFKDDKYSMVFRFSNDNGATYVDYPLLEKGKSYKAKVAILEDGAPVDLPCIDIDWSTSSPAPSGETSANVAEFTVAESTKIIAKIIGEKHYTQFSPSSWTGDWGGMRLVLVAVELMPILFVRTPVMLTNL